MHHRTNQIGTLTDPLVQPVMGNRALMTLETVLVKTRRKEDNAGN